MGGKDPLGSNILGARLHHFRAQASIHWSPFISKTYILFSSPPTLRALWLLLADSALTVGRGKTFWCVNRFFFFYENRCHSGTESRKMAPKVGRSGLSEGYKRVIDQNWGRMAKIKNSCLFPNKFQSLKKFWLKPFFGQKNFSAERKIGSEFLSLLRIFCPFDPMPDNKTMQTSCLGGFFCYVDTKTFTSPIKIRIFGPTTAKFSRKYAFMIILGQILAFFAHFVQCLTNNQCKKGASSRN